MVESHVSPGTKVLMMTPDKALNYADRGLRIVVASGLPYNDQLSWFERKYRTTRGVMAGLVRQKWPAQEALRQALLDTASDWTLVRGSEVKGEHHATELNDPGAQLGASKVRNAPPEANTGGGGQVRQVKKQFLKGWGSWQQQNNLPQDWAHSITDTQWKQTVWGVQFAPGLQK